MEKKGVEVFGEKYKKKNEIMFIASASSGLYRLESQWVLRVFFFFNFFYDFTFPIGKSSRVPRYNVYSEGHCQ